MFHAFKKQVRPVHLLEKRKSLKVKYTKLNISYKERKIQVYIKTSRKTWYLLRADINERKERRSTCEVISEKKAL